MSITLLADIAIKASLYLALLFVLAGLLRGSPAAVRHLLWSVGLVGLLALPVLSVVVPWRIGILPATEEMVAPLEGESAQPDPVASPKPRVESRDEAEAEQGMAIAAAEASGEEAAPPPAARGAAAKPRIDLGVIGLPGILAILWVGGAAAVLARLLAGLVAVRIVTRRGSRLDSPYWQRLLAGVSDRMGVAKPVRLIKSPQAPVPFGAGMLKPVVVFPEAVEGWSGERRLTVLLHEVAHLQRGDAVPHLIAQLVCAVFWFHPLAWLAARRLRVESERACDDLVLRAGTRPSQYVEHLIDIVRSSGRSWALAAAQPMAKRSEFEGRVLAILEPGIKRHGLTPTATLLVVMAVALTAVPLAAMGRQTTVADGNLGSTPLTATPAEPLATPNERDMDEPDAAEPGAEIDAVVDRPALAGGNPSPGADAYRTAESPADEGEAAGLRPVERSAAERSIPAVTARPAQEPADGAVGVDRVAALIAALGDADVEVRRSVVKALGSLQDTAAVRALMAALRQDSDPEVRRAAAWSLGEIEDARAVPALGEALRGDEDVEVRVTAAWALGEIEDAAAVEYLSAAIDDPERDIRLAVIHALGEIESADAVGALSAALRDNDPEIRDRAVWALGEIEDARAVPALGEVLSSDTEAPVRAKAAWALGEIEDAGAVDALAGALSDGDVEVRRAAVWALGEIEDARAVGPLTDVLGDSDPEVRKGAIVALGEIESARAVQPLLAALGDADAEVRSLAAMALGEIEDASAASGLAAALGDSEASVRRSAIWALGELELRSAPAGLIEALRDENAEVRRAAVHALGEIADPAAVAGLAEVARSADIETRRAAIWALAEIHHPTAYEVLVEALQDEDPEIRRLAARALGEGRN